MQDYAKTLEHVTKALGMSKEEQEAYIKKEQERLLRKHETYIEEELEAIKREVDRDMRQRQTLFGIVAYDRQQQKIRHFTMDINELAESHEDHLEIGSGRDGAEFYLTNKLQGVTPAHLEAHELAYFTMNAYCQSTMNQGVGGTPKIHIIGDQSKELSKKQAISLNNLCGAHMADANPRILTPEHTISIIKGILADDAAAYERGAEATRLNPHTFTEIAIPYNALQASSNAALFKK